MTEELRILDIHFEIKTFIFVRDSFLCYFLFLSSGISIAAVPESVMSSETAENLIKRVLEFCGENSDISFMFQGGEPLMAGIDFFKKFIATAEKLKDSETKIRYSLQTNGTLITDEFADFFKEHEDRF